MSEAHSQHPYWLLYQVVADSPRAPRSRQRHCWQRLVTKLMRRNSPAGSAGYSRVAGAGCGCRWIVREAAVADEEPVTTVTSLSTVNLAAVLVFWQMTKSFLFYWRCLAMATPVYTGIPNMDKRRTIFTLRLHADGVKANSRAIGAKPSHFSPAMYTGKHT